MVEEYVLKLATGLFYIFFAHILIRIIMWRYFRYEDKILRRKAREMRLQLHYDMKLMEYKITGVKPDLTLPDFVFEED